MEDAAYAVFGAAVHAPCDGRVVSVENALPDFEPPAKDPERKAGNHVMLAHDGGGYVLLAHLQRGSIAVAEGERVRRGDPLGRVGNSGNRSEPHLHVSAQRGPGETTLLDADPLPLRFDGRWLLRNALVRTHA